MTISTYLPGAEPFFLPGTSGAACLVIHGFMSSPREVRWLGEDIATRGHTVYGVRLAGHGVDYRLMRRTVWENWYYSALDGYYLLSTQYEKVFLVGHSLGGLLSLLLASQVAPAGVVAIATPASFEGRQKFILQAMDYLRPYMHMPDLTGLDDYIKAEQRQRGETPLGRVRYNDWSAAAVAELYKAMEAMHIHLPQVTAPLLLIYSQADQTVEFGDAEKITARVKSPSVQKQVLTQSGHNIPQDMERQQAFDWIAEFLAHPPKEP